jgi:2',3'-cyclic-nucleotide 2'-phosphodiesterase (5'-nucleotidase family)
VIRRAFLSALLAIAPLAAQVRPLTILHTNDLHAHLTPDEQGGGGFARLTTVVRQERARCAACLFMNAGDLVQGTPVSTLFHGSPMYEIANTMGTEVSTLGNHEFDYGMPRIREYARIARFPVLSANVVNAAGKSITGRPYVIKSVGGIRIAIIGVVMGDLVPRFFTAAQVSPWHVLPVVETVRQYARELRDRSDLIIVLGHIWDKEEVEAILHQVPEVSVVIAGHSSDPYPKMTEVDGRVAVLVDSYTRELGRLDLEVDLAAKKLHSAKWQRIRIPPDIAPAPDVEREVQKWEAKVARIVDVPIGTATAPLAQKSEELRRLVERAMAEESGADFAWVDPGNLRSPLPAGPLLARHIWNILPFDNLIVSGKFKGRDLPPAITARYPVAPEREYTVAVTDFTAENQAAVNQLQTTGLKFPRAGGLQRDAVIHWMQRKKVVP